MRKKYNIALFVMDDIFVYIVFFSNFLEMYHVLNQAVRFLYCNRYLFQPFAF